MMATKSLRSGQDIECSILCVENGLHSGIAIEGRPRIRWNLAERMAHYRVPGVSIAVINQGKIEWTKGYGVLEAGQPTPVTTETAFQAASISKPVAALAALHLVEQGLIDLDEDVNNRLVSWHLPDNEFTREKPVTLRGLVAHYAGLTVPGFRGYLAGEQTPTITEILDGIPPANSEPVRVDIEPGSQGSYSGGGYTVMQQLCTDVTGQPYASFLEGTVLEPLAMDHSTFQQPLAPDRFRDVAKGHGADGAMIEGGAHVYPELAAAGLWTTPSDLARFALEVQRAYAGESEKVVKASTADQFLTYQWQENEPSMHPLMPSNMGLGAFLTQTDGALYFAHSGGNEGYRCQLVALRDQSQGGVVMTNGNLGTLLWTEIFPAIGQKYGWPDFEGVTRTPVKLDPAILAAYEGEYEIAPEAIIHVTADGHQLFAQAEPFGSLKMELYPGSGTEFFVTEMPYPVSFVRDEEGQVVEMTFARQTARRVGRTT